MSSITVREIIERETGKAAAPETSLDSLGLDSLELLELLVELNIPSERVIDMETVADLIREAQ
jgi:acyl carrier protein